MFMFTNWLTGGCGTGRLLGKCTLLTSIHNTISLVKYIKLIIKENMLQTMRSRPSLKVIWHNGPNKNHTQ